jgi:FlaA1/EpsC-like NDP-sugar epimerase
MDESLKRSYLRFRNRHVLIGDVAAVIFAVLGSFALRLDVSQLPYYFPAVLIMVGVALLVKLPVYYFFGLYRQMWIYASVNELKLIAAAVTTASAAMSGVMLALIAAGLVQPGMPRSALGIDWLLSLLLTGGLRFALRILAEQSGGRRNGAARRVLVIGAGVAAFFPTEPPAGWLFG